MYNFRNIYSLVALLVFTPFLEASVWKGTVEWEQTGSIDFEDSAQDVSMEETRAGFGGSTFWRGADSQFALDASVQWLDADWTGNPLEGMVDPLYQNGQSLSLSGLWTRMAGDGRGYSLFSGVEAARTQDGVFDAVSLTDALSYRLGGSINFRYAGGIVLGVGILYRAPIVETDRDWLPIVQVFWPINENWTLQTRNGLVFNWRKDAEESQTASFSLLWNSDEWHLGKQNGFEYSIEREGLRFGMVYTWKVGRLSIAPGIGYTVAGETTIWSEAGRVYRSDLKPYFSGDVVLEYSF